MKIHALSHLDHGLTLDHVLWILEHFKDRTSFTLETIELPPELPPIMCRLHGPIMGDAEVSEREVWYDTRGDRAGKTRMVSREPRETRLLTVIAGEANGCPCVLYTAYAGPQAPREPWDPSLSPAEQIESEDFWDAHALTGEGVAQAIK